MNSLAVVLDNSSLKNSKRIIFIFLLLTFCLFFIDKKITIELRDDEHAPLRSAASWITELGQGKYWLILAALLCFCSWASLRMKKMPITVRKKIENLKNWSLHLFLAIISSGALVLLLKYIIGRARPTVPHAIDHELMPFTLNSDFQSFPSGHSQVIFTVAVLFSQLWPKAGIFFFICALIVAFTRILVLKHFGSDVIAGIGIGLVISYLSLTFWSKWIPLPVPFSRVR